MEPIVCNQLFSRRGLGYLWSVRLKIDPAQEKIINSLYNNRKKGSLDGQQTITYKLSNKKAGKLGWGRYYGSIGSLETLEKECRGTLCKEYYHDIDVVNCHPVLLVQYAKLQYNKDLPETEYYIENRDEVLGKISDNRDEAKQEVIRVFYGGRNRHPILSKLSDELKRFSKFLSTQSDLQELFKICQDEDNIYGSFLSFILQTEERKVMLGMKEHLESVGWSVDVLAYDGIMIRRNPKLTLDLNALENFIFEKTNYKVKTLEKELIGFDVPDSDEEIVKGVSKIAYLKMKEEFEKNTFYYYPNNTYCEISEYEDRFYTEDHAIKYFRNKYHFKSSDKFNDYTEFFPLWLKDTTKRCIREITFENKDTSDPEVYYKNLVFYHESWFRASPYNSDVNTVLSLFKTLIKINTNNDSILEDYLTKYLAHLLQKPFELPGVAIIISGEKGCGKDTTFDLVGQYVIGSKHFFNYQSNKQFFDAYDTNRKDKFLIKLEEADRKYFLEDASYLKSLITATKNTFNPKLQPTITTNNYIRYIFTTNKSNVAEMSQGERRFVLLNASSEKKGDFEFWERVRELLFTPEAGAIIADYLLSIDINNFTPRKLPTNSFQEAVIEAQKTSEQLFLESWDGEETTSSDLYNIYRSFCADNNLFFVSNSIAFGIKLLPYIGNNIINKKRNASGVVYYKNV
jgi:hypothetical protein